MYRDHSEPIRRSVLERLLESAGRGKICLIGDLCLDIYWLADMTRSELSRETPHYPLPVVEERCSPGGAGNVACNIAALKPGGLRVIGLAGTDWRGDLLLRALGDCGVDTSMVIRDEAVVTNTYIKPLRRGISDVVYEDPRLDFENYGPVSPETEQRILDALNEAAEEADVICVSDQMRFGCITPAVRDRLSALGGAGKTVIVDSRNHGAEYANVTVKPNEVEAVRAFADGKPRDLAGLAELAARIYRKNGRTALTTLGEMGCFVAEDGVVRIPACPVEPPIDFCGAGDTFLAGYGVMLAAGAAPVEAAQIANLCSAVTIRKIGVTGTASPGEVLEAYDLYVKEEIR